MNRKYLILTIVVIGLIGAIGAVAFATLNNDKSSTPNIKTSTTTATPATSTPDKPGQQGQIDPPVTYPKTEALLFRFAYAGGHCERYCENSNGYIEKDGTWKVQDGDQIYGGKLDSKILTEFKDLITTHANDLDGQKKEKMSCSSWVDGTDLDYYYFTSKGEVRISSCFYKITKDNPLFEFTINLQKDVL